MAAVGYAGSSGGGGGAAPSSSVQTQDSYGGTSSAGVSASYSRGDHRHGTPALPTAGQVGADPAGTAATAVAAHEIAADPHAQYATSVELNALADRVTALEGAPGGGTDVTFAQTYVTTGDITPGNDATFTPLAGLALALPAAVGDRVELAIACMINPNSGGAADFFDPCVVVGGSAVRFASSGGAVPAVEGDPSLYSAPATFRTSAGYAMSFTVTADDVSGGSVTFGIAHKGPGGSVTRVYASTDYPFRWQAKNYGAAA